MAIRLVCDHADIFAGYVSFSGAGQSASDAVCAPSLPIAAVHIHGTADNKVLYSTPGHVVWMAQNYITAPQTFAQSAAANGCAATSTTTLAARDIHTDQAGYETDVITADGCPDGGAVELWRGNGSSHQATTYSTFLASALTWLDEHNRNNFSVDTDGDGTPDAADMCPTDARYQANTGPCGCNAYRIDLDEDGIADSCSAAGCQLP